MVHHNTVSLDKLVEMAWVEILTKYAVGEECDFLVSPTLLSLYLFFVSFNLQTCILVPFVIKISHDTNY